MKIMLFQGGRPGVTYKMPADQPEAELADLLDGEVEFTRLGGRLALVSRADGEEKRLPLRYWLCRAGRAAEPIAGDCAVVGMSPEGRLYDLRREDEGEALLLVRPVE